jgi:hypothetical protein
VLSYGVTKSVEMEDIGIEKSTSIKAPEERG